MRIAFIPRYGRHAASSRLRCYAIAEAIQRQGLAEVSISEPGAAFVRSFDAFVLQKLNGYQVDHVAEIHPASRLVYDIDDAILGEHEKRVISDCVHAITTDTELRAQGIHEWFRGPVHVIPDPIDYEDGPPKPLVQPDPRGIISAAWFGNWPNFESVRPEMRTYQKLGYRIGAISDLSPERANMPGLELIPWSYETFPAELRKWTHCVLSHRGADQCKSENKLVAAIYLGVFPAYVSGPAYEALMSKLHALSPADAQAWVYENYRADVIARKAMEVYAG